MKQGQHGRRRPGLAEDSSAQAALSGRNGRSPMGTRMVRFPDPSAQARLGTGRRLDPAGTALMIAVSGSVLAASLLIASLSTDPGQVRALTAGTQPEPAPPPTLITAVP
jgi:hypothetical protein